MITINEYISINMGKARISQTYRKRWNIATRLTPMLTLRYANGLISIYQHFGEKGMLSCDEQEMERLKKIANIKD